MDYKNDNRTPRDRITGEFLSELLFTELGGDCECKPSYSRSGSCSCDRTRDTDNSVQSSVTVRSRKTAPTPSQEYGRNDTCRCTDRGTRESITGGGNVGFTGNYSFAMAYVPMQEFGELFDIEEGYCEGTIFKNLRFPFYPTPCRREGN